MSMKGKYSRLPYIAWMGAIERKRRNAFYFLERMIEIYPTFGKKVDNIQRATRLGQLTQKQANQQIWRELEHTVRKQR